MGGSNVANSDVLDLGSSIASILGVKGPLRFRPHGSTQKAHVVLRRVAVSEDLNDNGGSRIVARFSLFAQKRIEVKPGKEILLTVVSHDGQTSDQPLILEGDVTSSEDALAEDGNTQVADEDDTYKPPLGDAIPPKMRRVWTKKIEDGSPVIPPPAIPPIIHTSVGIQTDHVSKPTQVKSTHTTASSQTDILSKSVSAQVDSSLFLQRSIGVQATQAYKYTSSIMENDKTHSSCSSISQHNITPTHNTMDKTERSLSPMELDSLPESPQSSTRPTKSPSPSSQEPGLPTILPGLIAQSITSTSATNTQNIQAVPGSSTSTTPFSDILGETDIKRRLSSHSLPPAAAYEDTKPSKIPADFAPSVSFQEGSGSHALIKKEAIPSAVLSIGASSASLSKPSFSEQSQTPSISQTPIASSSKLFSEKTLPTGPSHFLRLYSSRALEKSPALSTPLQAQGPVATKPSSPPPDPKALAYIPSGPSSNPLGIRPSANTTIAISRSTYKVPTAPKTLTQTPSTKKPVVVGAGWPLVKVTNREVPPHLTVGTTSAVPPSLSNIVPYSSPSPPPSAPPPLPASAPPSKWKCIVEETSLDPTPINGPTGSCSTKDDKEGKPQDSDSFKRDALSLKDRIHSSPIASPVSPITPTSHTNDLRSRISDVSFVALQDMNIGPGQRSADEPILSTSSKILSYKPATSTQTLDHVPALPATPMTHPLPPKPVLSLSNSASRNAKRERAKSPESSRKKQRSFRWPTVRSNHSTRLLGDGHLGIRNIAFNSDGSRFALTCADRTIRIWNARSRAELARLAHNSLVVAVSWIDGDSGVVSLAEDGLVSKWTRTGTNHWQWAKVLDAGKNDRRTDDDQVCLAFIHDRIAVSFPRSGVKIWIWQKGNWHAQRSILRQNVTAIKFIDDGAAIVGGTRDGVLWYCEIPNGTLRAYAFLNSKIQTLDITPSGSHLLAGVGHSAMLVSIRNPGNKGSIEQCYSCKEMEGRTNTGFGAVLATKGQAVLFGNVGGCILVWDRKRANIVYGLDHEDDPPDETIQAVASFDGPPNKGYLVTGTKTGQLSWWSQPVAAAQGT